MPLILTAGCGVNSISFKLTDVEWENTDKGFVVKSHNWSDILINDPQIIQPDPAPLPQVISNNTNIIDIQNSSNMMTIVTIQPNLTNNDTIKPKVEVNNNSITIIA